MKENNTIVEVSQLSIGYPAKQQKQVIAKDLNFSISEGDLVGIVGTNGIGKSTLIRTLSSMQPALTGSIKLFGRSIESIPTLELANTISIVLTEAPASKNLTAAELVSLGRQPYTNWIGTLSQKDKECIQTAMKNTEVDTLKDKKCYELSDGQLQRVMIARALAQDTPLILLDEPTTHLDIYHRAYILKLIKRLTKDQGKTILFSSHEIDLAIQLSDKMLVMAPDTIYIDTPEQLIEQGCFNDLFPKETIQFNTELKRFTLKN